MDQKAMAEQRIAQALDSLAHKCDGGAAAATLQLLIASQELSTLLRGQDLQHLSCRTRLVELLHHPVRA